MAGTFTNITPGLASGTNTGDVTLGAVDSVPNAKGAVVAAQVLQLEPADGTHPGVITSGTQTIGGNKTFSGTVGASNLSGTNTGDVTLGAVGASPSANGASLAGQALTLQPADGTHPGVVTTAAQTFAGAKTFSNSIPSYNGLTTAWQGFPVIVASGDLTGQTSSTTLTSVTSAAAGTYLIGGNIYCTAFTSGALAITVAYTDPNNVARSYNVFGQLGTAATASTIAATGSFSTLGGQIITIKNATNITLTATLSGTATADFHGFIARMN